jgi:hypothetical protein
LLGGGSPAATVRAQIWRAHGHGENWDGQWRLRENARKLSRIRRGGGPRRAGHPATDAAVTVRVLVMLDIYFVSVKYVFVECKACVCLCEVFENLKCK